MHFSGGFSIIVVVLMGAMNAYVMKVVLKKKKIL
jgi:hypothetical protein